MTQLSSFSPVMKIIFGVFAMCAVITVITGITLVIYVTSMRTHDSEVASLPIVLHLTEELQRLELNLHFGVLHVRDGKDQTDHGRLLNQEISFEPIDRRGTIMATITYEKRLGVQFKCFADQGPYEYERIEQLLKNAGFSDSAGERARNRIYSLF